MAPRTPRRPERRVYIDALAMNGEVFHDRRELALKRPDRARDKLDGYAKVFLKIKRGRNLPVADADGYSDPYVDILLNDVLKDTTNIVRKNLNPIWEDGKVFEISIKSPADVLMLRVMDYDWGKDDDVLGFVEIPVADLEYNVKVQGWCCLAPKKDLEGTARERLKTLNTPREEEYGAILVELELRIVSNDPSDEWYAWCLPEPEFYNYPEDGVFIRSDLNMQKVMDTVDVIIATVMHRLLAPFLSFVSFVLIWRNFKLTFVFFACTLGMCLRPDHCLTLLFGLWGMVMLMLSNTKLREAIVANPSTVLLNDEGFQLVAAMQNTSKTVVFLNRVIQSLQGTVLDADVLSSYAAFATLEGKPVKSYEKLCLELLTSGEASNLLSFHRDPHPKSTLVKCANGLGDGHIEACKGGVSVGAHGEKKFKNKGDEGATEYLYDVHLRRTKTGQHQTVELKSSEIQLRTDLRWMGSAVVLALIPDSVEDTVMGYLPTLKYWRNTFESIADSLEDLFGWRSPVRTSTSLKVCIGLFALSLLCNPSIPFAVCFCIKVFDGMWLYAHMGCAPDVRGTWLYEYRWIHRYILVAITLYTFMSSTQSWTAYLNRRRGKKLASEHTKSNGRSWGFFKDPNSKAPSFTSKDITRGCSTAAWFSSFFSGIGKKAA